MVNHSLRIALIGVHGTLAPNFAGLLLLQKFLYGLPGANEALVLELDEYYGCNLQPDKVT